MNNQKLNEICNFLERNPALADCVTELTYSDVFELAEEFSLLQQRAEKAEAQLAELAKQEPDYTRYDCGACGHETFTGNYRNICPVCNYRPMKETGLFTHPSPPTPVKLPRYKSQVYPTAHRENDKINSWNEAIEACAEAIEAAGGSVADE